MKNKQYHIQPVVWLVKDEQSVKFHVANDDYFGTIATVINLAQQRINGIKMNPDNKEQCQKIKTSLERLEKTLKNLEKDFTFLQSDYKIVAKK